MDALKRNKFPLKGPPLLFIALFKNLTVVPLNGAGFKAKVNICVHVQGQPTEWIYPTVIRTFSGAHRIHNSGYVGQEPAEVFVTTESK